MTVTGTTFDPFATAVEHARSIRDGDVSSEELTRLYLSRIATHNPALNAVVISNEADALRTARDRDQDLKDRVVRGALHGVPVTVKESFNMTGLKTTVNAAQLKNHVARSDAYVVRKIRAAGATILGKTNIPTMLSDFQSFGPVYPVANNPYDLTRTPGGSTGGGAAAVAAGLTSLEIGSDMGGSIRLPSHFSGVFGLKPTDNMGMHGDGHVPPMPGSKGGFIVMASAGPLARSMADIELAWDVINEPTWKYFQHMPARPARRKTLSEYRIAWFDDVGRVPCGDETRRVLSAFVRMLEDAGVRMDKRPFEQAWLDRVYHVWGILFGAILGQDASWIVRQFITQGFRKMAKGSVTPVLEPLKRGLDLRFVDVSRAMGERIELVAELQRRFDDYDLIVSPVAAGPAFHHNRRHGPIDLEGRKRPYADYIPPFTIVYNAMGNPVLVVPAGRSGDGLPIGVQIAAPHYGEQELMHFGNQVEELGVRFVPPPGY